MLHAKPKGLFSSIYFLSEDEKRVATIDMKSLREAATLSIDARVLTMDREKLFSGDFLLKDEEGTIIARATKPSAWQALFIVRFNELEFELSRITIWKPGFALTWNGEQLGTIDRRQWFKRDADIILPESLPLEVRAFIFYLVMVQWNRDSSAAS